MIAVGPTQKIFLRGFKFIPPLQWDVAYVPDWRTVFLAKCVWMPRHPEFLFHAAHNADGIKSVIANSLYLVPPGKMENTEEP